MKRFLRRNKLLVIKIVPAIFIFILFASGFLNIPGKEIGKTIVLVTLLVITPIVFFINGFLSRKNEINFVVFSIPSYISFAIVFFVWMNSTALIYFVLYFISNFLGYMFFKLDKRLSEKNKVKLENAGFYTDKKRV